MQPTPERDQPPRDADAAAQDGRAPSSVEPSGGFFARALRALSAPLRWVRKQVARGLDWLREQLRHPLGWLFGDEMGFGLRWLLVTLLLAAAVGLIVGLLLTPVLGLIALLITAVWMAVRRSRADRDAEREDAAGAPAPS